MLSETIIVSIGLDPDQKGRYVRSGSPDLDPNRLQRLTLPPCINRLFAYCKGGNFNIHIWAWFGYFICLGKEIRFYL